MADRNCLTSLPPEVLQKLLVKLDQRQLACVVPVVCQVLRAAALAALQSIQVELSTKKKAEQFANWVKRHGHKHVSDLEILALPTVQVQLPFSAAAHLSSLVIEQGRYVHHASCTTALSQLTSLAMVDVTADEHLLLGIKALTGLYSLALDNLDFGPSISTSSRHNITSGAQAIWSNCKLLTALTCAHCDLDDSAVAQLTQHLSALQHLDLSGNAIQQAETLAPLPTSLTLLNLSHNHKDFDISGLLPALPQADSEAAADSSSQPMNTSSSEQQQLQHLEISGLCMSQPLMLSSLPGLTRLVADELQLPMSQQLLVGLTSISNMRHLQLRGTFGLRGGPPSIAADLTGLNHALAAMSRLTFLDLGHNRLLAREEHQHIVGCSLPELQVLMLDCLKQPSAPGPNASLQSAADFQDLVDNCPSLRHLDLLGRIYNEVTAAELQPVAQLHSSLTNLSFGSKIFELDDAILAVIAKLTSLQSLTVVDALYVTDVGLMSLTHLKQLQELQVTGINPDLDEVSEALVPKASKSGDRELKLIAKRNKAPNVWQQLATRCNRSPVCLRARQKELEHELAAAHKLAAKERKRAAKQNAAAQKEIATLRQQLSALQAAANSSRSSAGSSKGDAGSRDPGNYDGSTCVT